MVYHNPSMFLDLDTVDYPGLTCSALLVLDSDFRCRFPSFMSLMEDNGMEEIQQLLTMPETEANLSECLGSKLLIPLLSIVVVLAVQLKLSIRITEHISLAGILGHDTHLVRFAFRSDPISGIFTN